MKAMNLRQRVDKAIMAECDPADSVCCCLDTITTLVRSERASAWAECREAAAKVCEPYFEPEPIENIWTPRAATDSTARDIALRIRALERPHE